MRPCGIPEELLARRAEEARRYARAEEQLRVMLVQLEKTNSDLAAALVQKALPPATVTETPRRVRWWWPWGKR